MTFTQYMLDYSPVFRGLVGAFVMIGVSLAMVKVFHSRVVNLDYVQATPDPSEDDEKDANETAPESEWTPRTEDGRKVTETFYLAGIVRALCGTAFVFLLAFTLNNLWSSADEARDAVQFESAALVQAYLQAEAIPADAGQAEVRSALNNYWQAAVDQQWPLMRSGDKDQALESFSAASLALARATSQAQKAGGDQASTWSGLTDSITEMTKNGSTRILRTPGPQISGVLMVIMLLGITNLVVTAIFQPARLRPSLVLIGLMATVTATLVFLVVEVSNPYLGGAAIQPPPFSSEALP